MGSWSTEAQARAAERHRDAGAWLQRQKSSALHRAERNAAEGQEGTPARSQTSDPSKVSSQAWSALSSPPPTPALLPSTTSCWQRGP